MNRVPITTMLILAGGLTAGAAEPGRTFRLGPAPGSAWTLEAATSVGASAAVFGQAMDVGVHERLLATLVVERIDPDGSAVVLLTVDRLQGIQREVDKEPVEYDSSDPATSMDDETWREFRKRGESIVGQRWRLVVRPDGEIADVKADADAADVDPLLDHAALVSSAEVIWLAVGGREVVRFPDHPVAVGATWLHEPAGKPANAGEPAKPSVVGRWLGTGEPKREASFESRYAARQSVGARTVDVVTTRHLPPRRTFSLEKQTPVDVDGRLVFDATTGDFVEGAWEGGFQSKTAVWWMLGTNVATDVKFALRVTPAPAPSVRQAQAVRPLPPVR